MVTLDNFGWKMTIARNPFSTQPQDVHSWKHVGLGYQGSTNDIISLPYGNKAGNFAINHSMGFDFPSSASRKDMMKFSYNPTLIYSENHGLLAMVRTSSNVFAFTDISKNGPAFGRDDIGIEGCLDATNRNRTVEYVRPNREIGLWKSPEFIPDYSKHGMTAVDIPITRLSGEVPINKVGLYVSKIANLEQDFRDVLFRNYIFETPGLNKETKAYLEFLESKGIGPAREINRIGMKNFSAIAATYYTNKTAGLAASRDFYEKALRMARKYGLEGDEAVKFAKRAVWYHELYHVANREKLSESDDEARVGHLLAEFFGTRASMLEEKISRHYKAMEAENIDYADAWETGKIKKASLKTKIDRLISKYMTEAREKGLDEEEARDYVANKLEEELEREVSDSEEKTREENEMKDHDEEREYANDDYEEADESEAANDNYKEDSDEEETEESETSEAA